jgi:hypothetical protein
MFMKSSIFWDVVRLKSPDVSKEYVASILRVEEWAEQETSLKAGGKQSREGSAQALLATCFHAGFLLGSSFPSEDGSDMFLWNIGWLQAAISKETELFTRATVKQTNK